MPTELNKVERPKPVEAPLSTNEITELLIRHYGLHEGSYVLSVEFQIGVGPMGPDGQKLPGLSVGIAKLGLIPATPGAAINVVDAEKVNPLKQARKPKK